MTRGLIFYSGSMIGFAGADNVAVVHGTGKGSDSNGSWPSELFHHMRLA
jgi:hypothetical protein